MVVASCHFPRTPVTQTHCESSPLVAKASLVPHAIDRLPINSGVYPARMARHRTRQLVGRAPQNDRRRTACGASIHHQCILIGCPSEDHAPGRRRQMAFSLQRRRQTCWGAGHSLALHCRHVGLPLLHSYEANVEFPKAGIVHCVTHPQMFDIPMTLP
jgi:hypothetical protein